MPAYYTVQSRIDRFFAEGGRSKHKMAWLELDEPNLDIFSTEYKENTEPAQTGIPTEITEKT